MTNDIEKLKRMTDDVFDADKLLGLKGKYVGNMIHIGIADLAEIYRALQNRIVPEGWVFVPKEPTDEMLLAAWKSQYMHVGGDAQSSYILAQKRVSDEKQRAMDIEAYKAMIAAAPKGEE